MLDYFVILLTMQIYSVIIKIW